MQILLRTLLLLAFLGISLQAQAVTIKIATVVPDGTAWMKAMRSAGKSISEQTRGRVKLRFYPGGIMGNDNSVLRKIRVGQLHGGAITGGGLSTIYPDARLYSMPFLFRSFDEVDYLRQQMDPVMIAGLKEKGYISYGLSEGGFAYLMSNTKILSIEDLRAQKAWSPEGDPISRAAFEAVDVSPIALPITDVLTGLQTGLANTIANSPIGAIALQWHTRVKYMVDVPLIYLYASLVIHKKALKRVSPEDRKIISMTFEQLNRKNREAGISAREALKKQRIEFLNPSLEHMNEWRNAVDRSIEKMGTDGTYTPQVRNKMLQLLNDFRKTGGGGETMRPRNILSAIPAVTQGEQFTELLTCRNVSIERIVSAPGTVSEVFVQEKDEWIIILEGSARLHYEDQIITLEKGDTLFIPAKCPHQVLETSAEPLCVWLTVHIRP